MAKEFLNPAHKRTKPLGGLTAILRSPRDVIKEAESNSSDDDVQVEKPKTAEKRPKQTVQKIDRRKKEDKKVTFTNSMRGTLLDEIHNTIKSYRKAVDVDYTLAKFLEEASQEQIKVLKSKIS